MMKCEKCGKELDHLLVGMFSYDGSDRDVAVPISEYPENAVVFETNSNWTGYGLSEEEKMERINCPFCKEFPFECTEVQEYEIIRLVCFKKDGENNA